MSNARARGPGLNEPEGGSDTAVALQGGQHDDGECDLRGEAEDQPTGKRGRGAGEGMAGREAVVGGER
jgi:hypothetical protein